LKKSKIKKTKNKNKFNENIICPIIRENYIIHDNINDNTNNLLSNNSINSNINCFINNDCNINNNNINDFTCFNMNNFNFSESLFDLCPSIKSKDDIFPDRIGFNDSFKSINLEERNLSNLSIGEQDNVSSINKNF